MLCTIAGVSRGGYYKWLIHSNEPRKDHDDYLLIKKIFDQGKSKYGFRTIQMKLFDQEQMIMNHKKIIRIMRENNLNTKIRRVNPYKAIFKRTLEHRTFENKLNREFSQGVPGKVFCTDITYLKLNNRFTYLSVIKDIASREVVGWKLDNHLEMGLVLQTIEKMKRNLNLKSLKGSLIHSDQGFHYTNPLYIEEINKIGMVQSMSRKGNCIDNAPMESFFGHLKDDIDYKTCTSFDELNLKVEEYVQYYNQERRRWSLKKMTPVEYRSHLLVHL